MVKNNIALLEDQILNYALSEGHLVLHSYLDAFSKRRSKLPPVLPSSKDYPNPSSSLEGISLDRSNSWHNF